MGMFYKHPPERVEASFASSPFLFTSARAHAESCAACGKPGAQILTVSLTLNPTLTLTLTLPGHLPFFVEGCQMIMGNTVGMI